MGGIIYSSYQPKLNSHDGIHYKFIYDYMKIKICINRSRVVLQKEDTHYDRSAQLVGEVIILRS